MGKLFGCCCSGTSHCDAPGELWVGKERDKLGWQPFSQQKRDNVTASGALPVLSIILTRMVLLLDQDWKYFSTAIIHFIYTCACVCVFAGQLCFNDISIFSTVVCLPTYTTEVLFTL